MKAFLQELAETVYRDHPKWNDLTLVFPNRRAVLYFRKHLASCLEKPAFTPKLLTIEDFIASFSPLKVPDKLELVYILYQVYTEVFRSASDNGSGQDTTLGGFDEFWFWGEMLLRDFDEIDRHMVEAEHLFKDLSHQKELDSSFDFLTEEQKHFLKSFWSHFDENQSANKRKFLYIWRQLPGVYKRFRQTLLDRGLAFEGMLHREVAEQLAQGAISYPPDKPVRFVGFNALTKTEETIISNLVDKGSAVIDWDVDAYYVNNEVQEAGRFFREYQQHPVLGRTFNKIPSNLLQRRSETGGIRLYGAPQPVGQAKLMAQVLEEAIEKGMDPQETLIVLPDEKLLLPVLHGISGFVDKFNVTMGFPLGSTPLYNFIELLIELQTNRRVDHFHHKQVLAILSHPYAAAADAVSSHHKRKEILKHNWVHIPAGFLATEVQLHRLVFRPVEETPEGGIMEPLILYIRDVLNEMTSLTGLGDLDKEFVFHFLRFFNRIETVFCQADSHAGKASSGKNDPSKSAYRTFLRLFRQLVRSFRIPFSGEPLKGLQIMGVLETRNLDFKNVFILSLNEGSFPALSSKGSYIPYNIRKAYKLPTVEHQDAIYAYLFYRILQRAENVYLFYNSETDVLGQGEMSRYLQQLVYESGLPVTRNVLHNPIQPRAVSPIVVDKNAAVLESIRKLNEGSVYFKGISPSALNSYIECRLRFYFRHVAKIKEADEVEEELDARVLGNFLHEVMEHFYKRIREKKKSRQVEVADFYDYEKVLDALIDDAFIRAYRLDPSKKVEYEGQRLVVREVVKRFATRIIEMDKAYAPFIMEGLEQEGLTYAIRIDHEPGMAVIGGKIDRIDRKDNLLRVIDYKTGKDRLNFESVASLFSREGKRNKAAFQTILYALLYKRNYLTTLTNDVKLVPGLINRMNLFDEGFTFGLQMGKEDVTDVEPLLPEFEARLREVLNELFDPARPFDQTRDTDNCKNCAYTRLCYR